MTTSQKEPKKLDEALERTISDIVIDKTAEKAGNYLIDKAKKQLNKVLFESKKIQETQSRLKLVMQRYNLQKSTFSTISDWYTERPLWQKLAVASLVIAGAVIAGLFVHAVVAALLAAAAASISLITHIFLEEHSSSSANCNEKLCEDLDMLETRLASRMKDLSTIEEKLKGALTSMATNNLHLAEDEQKLREELAALNQQIEYLSETNKDLNGITQQLEELNKGLIDNLTLIHSELQSSHQVMQSKTSELEATNDKLLSSDQKLNENCDELKNINVELTQSIKEFSQLCVDVRQSISNPPSSERTRTLLAESNSVIADCDALYDSYQRSFMNRRDNSNHHLPFAP